MEAFSRYTCQELLRHPEAIDLSIYMPYATGLHIQPGRGFDPFAKEYWATPASAGGQATQHAPGRGRLRRVLQNPCLPKPIRVAIQHTAEALFSPRVKTYREIRNRLNARQFDVIHCPYQGLWPPPPYSARAPYVINLHDLQHEHYPDYFPAEELASRRRNFPRAAHQAAAIVCAAEHVKQDIIHYCHVSESKVFVVQWGPPEVDRSNDAVHQIETLRKARQLPERFIYYPAAFWRHKNHLRLLEAMRLLVDEGLALHLVTSGASKSTFESAVREKIHALNLAEHVHPLGYVSYEEVSALYHAADFIVLPSEYEATSGPLMEAMTLGLPACCARIADHAELVGDTLPMFDPRDTRGMADAIRSLATNVEFRTLCGQRARQRIHQRRSWDRFGSELLDVYRFAAGKP